jgi:hypothetical protein
MHHVTYPKEAVSHILYVFKLGWKSLLNEINNIIKKHILFKISQFPPIYSYITL